jgi:hypothetical protein
LAERSVITYSFHYRSDQVVLVKKLLAIALSLLFVTGAVMTRGDNTEAVITFSDVPAVADGGLAALGPVDLVSHAYTPSFQAACVEVFKQSVYFLSFNGSDLGSAESITSVLTTNGSAVLAGGTVSLIGSAESDSCAGASQVVAIVSGTLTGGHEYSASVSIGVSP